MSMMTRRSRRRRRTDSSTRGCLITPNILTSTLFHSKESPSGNEIFLLRRVDRNGGGGIVVDSGTTFTMLPAKFYNRWLRNSIVRSSGYTSGLIGSNLVPSLVLHFAGNGDGKEKKRKVGCLMLMNGGDESELVSGPGAILGNYQQQGFEVVYDLLNRRVWFTKRKCPSLWDTLNQD